MYVLYVDVRRNYKEPCYNGGVLEVLENSFITGSMSVLPAAEARGVAKTRGLPIPSSSRRMKADWLKKVVVELEVPVTAAATYVRVMLEGKLRQAANQRPSPERRW